MASRHTFRGTMRPAREANRRVISALTINSAVCGEGVEVRVAQVSRDKAELTCGKCQRRVMVAIPGGRVDRDAFSALEDGVERLHATTQTNSGEGV